MFHSTICGYEFNFVKRNKFSRRQAKSATLIKLRWCFISFWLLIFFMMKRSYAVFEQHMKEMHLKNA